MSVCFQIDRRFPGLMMKLLVEASSNPVVRFDPNKVTVQAKGTVTAYAIQPNAMLTPLFILNLVGYTAGITNQTFLWFVENENVFSFEILCRRQV